MAEASTQTVAAVRFQNGSANPLTVKFPPSPFGSVIFRLQEYRTTVSHKGYNFDVVFRAIRGLSQEESHPSMC